MSDGRGDPRGPHGSTAVGLKFQQAQVRRSSIGDHDLALSVGGHTLGSGNGERKDGHVRRTRGQLGYPIVTSIGDEDVAVGVDGDITAAVHRHTRRTRRPAKGSTPSIWPTASQTEIDGQDTPSNWPSSAGTFCAVQVEPPSLVVITPRPETNEADTPTATHTRTEGQATLFR